MLCCWNVYLKMRDRNSSSGNWVVLSQRLRGKKQGGGKLNRQKVNQNKLLQQKREHKNRSKNLKPSEFRRKLNSANLIQHKKGYNFDYVMLIMLYEHLREIEAIGENALKNQSAAWLGKKWGNNLVTLSH